MHQRPTNWGAAVFAACLGVVLLATAPAAAQTRAEYVKAAEPHCASANRDIARLNRRFEDLHARFRYDAAGQTLKKTGVRLSRSIADVRAITPPLGDESLIKKWLDLVQRIADNNIRLGKAEASERFGDYYRIRARNKDIRRKAHGLVAAFGFRACTGR